MPPKRDPWERLEDESSQRYKAFECYLMLDPRLRTVDLAWREYRKIERDVPDNEEASNNFRVWYRTHDWKERALAYDDYLAKLRRTAREQGIKQEAKRQAISVEKMRTALFMRFNYLDEKIDDLLTAAAGEGVKVGEVAALMRVQLDITKLLSDEPVNGGAGDPIDSMSEDDLAKAVFGETGPAGAQEGDSPL